MKNLLLVFAMASMLTSCKDKQNSGTPNATPAGTTETPGFFPVTSYLKGQISEIKSGYISPLRITIRNNRRDSAWLKNEQLDSVFAEFLTPEIDSINRVNQFRESRFHDQTLNSITFTYEPVEALPASVFLKRWDVYVTPQTGQVKRIYIEKYTSEGKEMQLTWQARGNSKIVYFAADSAGEFKVEKEEMVIWNFEEEEL